jgi:hypothetical protein
MGEAGLTNGAFHPHFEKEILTSEPLLSLLLRFSAIRSG